MQLAVNIVVLASIYALIACGYVLIYRVSRVLNLAHGELMMLGAYLLLTTASAFSGNAFVAIAAADRAQPRRRRSRLRAADAQDGGRDGARRGADHGGARHSAARADGPVLVGAAAISGQALGLTNPALALPGGGRISTFAAAIVVATALAYGGLFLFLQFGRWGVRMRAAGQNPLLAAQRGIRLHADLCTRMGSFDLDRIDSPAC